MKRPVGGDAGKQAGFADVEPVGGDPATGEGAFDVSVEGAGDEGDVAVEVPGKALAGGGEPLVEGVEGEQGAFEGPAQSGGELVDGDGPVLGGEGSSDGGGVCGVDAVGVLSGGACGGGDDQLGVVDAEDACGVGDGGEGGRGRWSPPWRQPQEPSADVMTSARAISDDTR
jgi:hypothetical protein